MLSKSDLNTYLKAIESAKSDSELESIRIKLLGKKGVVTLAVRSLGDLKAADKPKVGKQLNTIKASLTNAIKARQNALVSERLAAESENYIDLTAPGGGHELGHPHPLKELQKQLIEVFRSIGFEIASGPEIETDWYNFEALNIPAGHPARDMQDTFYLKNGAIPRTHTSSVQIRYMETHRPPIRIIAPGNVYRNEDEDATHLWAFQQIEGLVVDENISLAELKGTLLYMFRSIAGKDINVSLRPSYFPYVEPALEVYVTCMICKGKDPDCRTCKGTGWIEMLGAGMVHPQVLRNVGIDPEKYSGFAFGGGLERIAALMYQIPDIRYLWRPDLRFLEQF